jgi:hypothetical protein
MRYTVTIDGMDLPIADIRRTLETAFGIALYGRVHVVSDEPIEPIADDDGERTCAECGNGFNVNEAAGEDDGTTVDGLIGPTCNACLGAAGNN